MKILIAAITPLICASIFLQYKIGLFTHYNSLVEIHSLSVFDKSKWIERYSKKISDLSSKWDGPKRAMDCNGFTNDIVSFYDSLKSVEEKKHFTKVFESSIKTSKDVYMNAASLPSAKGSSDATKALSFAKKNIECEEGLLVRLQEL